jgi:hypothetical protein
MALGVDIHIDPRWPDHRLVADLRKIIAIQRDIQNATADRAMAALAKNVG